MARRSSSTTDRDPTRLAVIGLAAVVVGILVIGLGLVRSVGLFGLNDPAREVVFPKLQGKLDKVARITIAGSEMTTTLRRSDDGWAVMEKDGYPAKARRVDAVLKQLAQMPALKRKQPPKGAYAALGVAAGGSDSTRITLTSADGTTLHSFFLGTEKAAPGAEDLKAYHIRAVNANNVWLADADLGLSTDPMAWIDTEVFAIPRTRMRAVKTAPDTGEPVHIRRDSPQDARFSGVNLGDIDLEGKWVLGELVVPFKGLRVTDVAKAETPLEPGGDGQGFVSTFDGVKIHFDLSDRGEGVWARFAATGIEPVVSADSEENGENAAGKTEPPTSVAELNARLRPWRFRLPAFQAKRMRRAVADLPRKGVATDEGG